MPRSLLCATDGSKASAKGVACAVALAQQLGATLTVLTVSQVSEERAAKTHFWDSRLLGAVDAQLHQELEAAAATARAAGQDCRLAIAFGRHPGRAIADYAAANGHDHIVLGTHGRGRVGQALLGSVASDVVAHATCPVTLVR
jgi:nucleotide-binding universal stress UspA family protein